MCSTVSVAPNRAPSRSQPYRLLCWYRRSKCKRRVIRRIARLSSRGLPSSEAIEVKRALLTLPLLISLVAAQAPSDQDVLLKAMQDEMARTRQLRIVNLDVPYYVEYRVEDDATLEIEATLGALV